MNKELQILRKRARFYDIAKDQYIERYREILQKQFLKNITAEQYVAIAFVANTIREFLLNVFLVSQADVDRIYDEEIEKSGYFDF